MTARQAEVSRARQRFDLTALEQALCLMSLAALGRALGPKSGLIPPEVPGAALAEPLAWLLSGKGEGDRRTASAASGMAARFLVTEPPRFSPLQTALLADRIPALMSERIGDWFDTRLGRSLSAQPAEAGFLADPIALTAFGGFDHRVALARVIRATLRHEVLLFPPPDPIPTSSPATQWLMIAIDPAVWPRARGHSAQALKQRIEATALLVAETRGWASFWDQWLLLRARQAGRTLPASLATLPLLAEGVAALDGAAGEDPPACAGGWREAAPGYAGALLRRSL